MRIRVFHTTTMVTRDHLSVPYKQGAGVDVFIFTTVYWSTDLTRIIIIHSHPEPRGLWRRGSGPSLLCVLLCFVVITAPYGLQSTNRPKTIPNQLESLNQGAELDSDMRFASGLHRALYNLFRKRTFGRAQGYLLIAGTPTRTTPSHPLAPQPIMSLIMMIATIHIVMPLL